MYSLFKKQKKGIELSVNFLVIIILSIVMLGMGVMMIRQFYDQSLETQKRISEKEEEQILSMLNRGEKVAMPINIKTVNKDEIGVVGVGIFNIKNEDTTFSVEILDDLVVAYDPLKEPIDIYDDEGNLLVKPIPEMREITLKPNEQATVNIFIRVNKKAPKGNYVFPLKIMRYWEEEAESGDGYNNLHEQYGTTQKFIINVP